MATYSSKSLDFPASGDQVTVTVLTNQPTWSYKIGDPSWVSAVKSSSDKLLVTVSSNETTASRETTILITAEGKGLITTTLTIKQQASEIIPELTVDGELRREVGYHAGGILVKTVTNMKSIGCTSDSPWLKASVDGTYINVSYDENPSEVERTGTITIVAPADEAYVSASVEVVQAAAPPVYPTENLSAEGTSNS